MEPQEEPDYDALWQRIVADAEAQAEEWRWQARWFEEASYLGRLGSSEREYAQRLASRAFIRHQIQRIDLAEAINQGDISHYLKRWYPEVFSPANGSRIEFIERSWDEAIRGAFPPAVHYDECELFYTRTPSVVNPAAIWRKYAARRRTQRQLQACEKAGYQLSTWSIGEDRVGPRSRLRQWARRVLRRR